jgi:phosphoenolpyruvate synthase/pyruvate phosphate dikinase
VLFPDRVSDEAKEIINERAKNDRSPQDFFIRKLSEGVGSIAAAFYPRPIIVRLGDFKSNEYCRLIGGENFEPGTSGKMLFVFVDLCTVLIFPFSGRCRRGKSHDRPKGGVSLPPP